MYNYNAFKKVRNGTIGIKYGLEWLKYPNFRDVTMSFIAMICFRVSIEQSIYHDSVVQTLMNVKKTPTHAIALQPAITPMEAFTVNAKKVLVVMDSSVLVIAS